MLGAPISAEVAGLVGYRNIFAGAIVSKDGEWSVIDLEGLRLRATTPGWLSPSVPVGVAIRSEDIAIANPGTTPPDGVNVIPLTLNEIREEGLGLRISEQATVALDTLLPRSIGTGVPQVAGKFLGLVRPEHVHLFQVPPPSQTCFAA